MNTSSRSQFKINGVTYMTVQGDGYNDCEKCAFAFVNCQELLCTAKQRIDKKDVYFKEVKK